MMTSMQFTPQMGLIDQLVETVLSNHLRLDDFDLVFVITAVIYNLLIAGIFIAQKNIA